ncbi:MAG: TIGR02099 family protein, partial [Cycloclasticus sp.]
MSKVRFFGHSLLWVFTVSLILLAVFIATARFILEDIPAYKNDLEVYLSEEMAGDVQISGLSARMEGFKPQLSLKKVRLDELNRQTNTLSIGEIRLSFNPLNFFSGDLKPSQITLVDGRFSIIGLSSDQESGDSSGDFSWLLEGRRFEIIDSQIIWQDDLRDLPDVTLDQAQVVFQNNGQEHTL